MKGKQVPERFLECFSECRQIKNRGNSQLLGQGKETSLMIFDNRSTSGNNLYIHELTKGITIKGQI